MEMTTTEEDEEDEDAPDPFYNDQLLKVGAGAPQSPTKVAEDQFFVCQIGYLPIPFMVKDRNYVNAVQTNKGAVGYKYYPVLLTDKSEDGARGMVVQSSGGKGFVHNADCMQDRCNYLVYQGCQPKYGNSNFRAYEADLDSGFIPAFGSYLDPPAQDQGRVRQRLPAR
jgi:hypothetical protein